MCLHAPSPLAAWPHQCAPRCPPCAPRVLGGGALFPPPSACGVRPAPPLCANGECRAARKRYAPPPSAPRPRSVEQDNASAGPPRAAPLIPPPFTHERGHRLRHHSHHGAQKRGRGAPPPALLRPAHARTHARERSTRTREGGAYPFPPLPHSRVCAKRARGWTASWETAPLPRCSLPARQTGCGDGGAPFPALCARKRAPRG
jgi:hypothetical protein